MESSPSVATVTITPYPPSMTGRKLRKQLGLPERIVAKESFRLALRFRSIKPEYRLAFLQRAVDNADERIPFGEMRARRAGFNRDKVRAFPMAEDCPCYVCGARAALRHHVKPLAGGGRNKRNNIVPLCQSCHADIHPHLSVRSSE